MKEDSKKLHPFTVEEDCKKLQPNAVLIGKEGLCFRCQKHRFKSWTAANGLGWVA